MITVFVCVKEGCPNFNVEYRFEGVVKKCECGGCGKSLKPARTESEVVDVVE